MGAVIDVEAALTSAEEIEDRRRVAVDQLASVRSLLQHADTLGEIKAKAQQERVGALFPRQFPNWAPEAEAVAAE